MYFANPKNEFERTVNARFEEARSFRLNVNIVVTSAAYIYDLLTAAQQKELSGNFCIIINNCERS